MLSSLFQRVALCLCLAAWAVGSLVPATGLVLCIAPGGSTALEFAAPGASCAGSACAAEQGDNRAVVLNVSESETDGRGCVDIALSAGGKAIRTSAARPAMLTQAPVWAMPASHTMPELFAAACGPRARLETRGGPMPSVLLRSVILTI